MPRLALLLLLASAGCFVPRADVAAPRATDTAAEGSAKPSFAGDGTLQEHLHVHRTPGRTETRQRQRATTRPVTRYEYRCRSVSRPVTKYETTYEYKYDYVSKTSKSVPVSKSVTRYEYQQECRSEPVTTYETHYETVTETHYVPPQEHVTKTYDKSAVLIEAEPEVLVTPRHRQR